MDLNELKEEIVSLQNKVNNDLSEIRKTKREIAQLKKDIYSRIDQGRYIRDDKRIVLSAPEIIIGDVDAQGMLIGSGTHVVIRGNDVRLDGVGTGGKVSTQATRIINTAVDPGIDGQEAVVQVGSCIINTARAISLDSHHTNTKANCMGTFIDADYKTPPSGTVLIHGEREVKIDASVPGTKQKENLYGKAITELNKKIETTQAAVNTSASAVTSNLNALKTCLDKQDVIQKHNIMKMRFDIADVYKDNKEYNNVLNLSYQSLENYYRYVSVLAEYKRQLKSLEEDKNNIAAEAAYKTTTTGAQVIINGERISVTSQDADGNKRTNKEAGIYLNANNIDLNSYQDPKDKSMTMMPYSSVNIASKNINLHTSDITGYEVTDTTVKGTYNPTGNVNINSKHVNIESMKKEIAKTYAADQGNTKVTLTETVKDYPTAAEGGGQNQEGGGQNNKEDKGILLLKGNNIQLAAVDKDEKADGKIELNAMNTEITAIDKKNKEGEQKAATKKSLVNIFADSIITGFRYHNEKTLCSQNMIAGIRVGIGGKERSILAQGDDPNDMNAINFEKGIGMITAKNGLKIESKLKVAHDTTFESNVLIAGKLEAKNVEVTGAFKSPKMQEGAPNKLPDNKSNEKIELKLLPEK